MLRKQIQIGLVHAALAMTLVPINSTLNRVMIKELALSATLVTVLAVLPYLFSPIQVAIGSFSDRHPIFGYRRTPYILFGLVLCVMGVMVAPFTAYLLYENFWAGILIGAFTFSAWGMGYNFATVSYFSLATEISGEKGRSRLISVMFVIMILAIILTSIGLSRLLEVYSQSMLIRSFWVVGLTALVMGLLGVAGVEKRSGKAFRAGKNGESAIAEKTAPVEERYPVRVILQAILGNRQVVLFFVYLILMLAAILGQDILLEPFAAEAFGLPVNATTRITSIWGVTFLVSLLVTGALERRLEKIMVARVGAWGGILAFILISMSGMMGSLTLFYLGVVLLGLATGLVTVSNLSLMLDMTVPGSEGLYIGAWGMANAFSRLVGWMMSGVVRDIYSLIFRNQIAGYVVVFLLEAAMLLVSLVILRKIDVSAFQRRARATSLVERAALASES
jgi:MFS transporter, BCD family, chlorophyll transporter